MIQGSQSGATVNPGRHTAPRLAVLLVCGAIVIYTSGYLAWYSGTPLGLVPVADEREILALAAAIATGHLPHEAFYRAPGYPAVLALMLKLGWPQADLVLGARLLNGLCHLANSWLCHRLASRVWHSSRAGLLAAGLVGLNPVLLHFAGDALDITLAMTLVLGELIFALGTNPPRPGASSLCLGLAGLCRPQLLSLLLLPLLASKGRTAKVIAALGPALLVLGAFGLLNHGLASDFRVLPWQGAFNFWAANHAGSNGRYFAQTRSIDTYDDGANTARIESEILYQEANPDVPDDYRAATRWWQTRAVDAITTAPLSWARLMASKLRYLVNNEEQYNNKSFAFHKARSPWLAPNPLCWALVFTAGMAGLSLGHRDRRLQGLALALAMLAAGTLLFYVSDRFRAPMVPLLAVAAGGLVKLRLRSLGLAAVVACTALASSLWPVDYPPQETWVQDHLLLARSANALQQHALALSEADAALLLAPGLASARSTRCVVAFNTWLSEAATADWESDCEASAAHSQSARLLAGYARWQRGEVAAAQALWREIGARAGALQASALAALWWTGGLDAAGHEALARLAASPEGRVLRVTAAAKGDPAAARAIAAELGEARARAEIRAVQRIWAAESTAAAPRPTPSLH